MKDDRPCARPKREAGRRGEIRGGFAAGVDGRGSIVRKLTIPKLSFALAALLAVWAGNSVRGLAAGMEPEGGYQFTTFAGRPGPASLDGEGLAARFADPKGVAVDGAGNVYVADTGNHTIRKITPGGVVATLAGSARESGSADGTGSAARFNSPEGVVVDSGGNVYVADAWNSIIRKITPGGEVTTLAGSAGSWGSSDGPGGSARFADPKGVAVDGAGNVYVADTGNHAIRKITPGGVVTTLAGSAHEAGSSDGIGGAARFFYPRDVAVDGGGNVYVADAWNHTIRKITPGGEVATLAGSAREFGGADGPGGAARFYYPEGVSVDGAGNVYVADSGNHTTRKITPGGVVVTLAGSAQEEGRSDGTGGAARFFYPRDVAVDSRGNSYVADSGNRAIRKITEGGVVATWAGSAGNWGSSDGTEGAARFYYPGGVSVDSGGNLYVADRENHTIRKVTPRGAVATWVGSAGLWGNSDGTEGAARFYYPGGVSVDSGGNVYVADAWNHTIRKITPGGVVATLAGSAGEFGGADGPGGAARFYHPEGVSVDSGGNIYVADRGNHTIRKITPGGEVTTLAGSAGNAGSADGTGTSARFFYPVGVAVDSGGNIYVADAANHAIRKITPGGEVTTLVRWVGNVGAAQGGFPTGVAVDRAGNIYVSETSNHSILVGKPVTKVDPAPSLMARREGGQIILSWPQTAVGYGLEQSGQLGAGAAWSPITTGIGTEGPNFTHTHAPTQGIRFFRLRKP